MSELAIRTRGGDAADAERVVELQRRELGREHWADRVRGLLADYPSVMLEEGAELIGFAYSVELAPDILELANILIATDHRGRGLGSRLVAELEERARPRFAAMIVVNSDLHAGHDKRDARGFYESRGYRRVLETPDSTVLAKSLRGS